MPVNMPTESSWLSPRLDRIEQLEDQLTVYRESSEVSRLNQAAAAGAIRVESRLFELLELAVLIHSSTGGAYDITSGPLSKPGDFFAAPAAYPMMKIWPQPCG